MRFTSKIIHYSISSGLESSTEAHPVSPFDAACAQLDSAVQHYSRRYRIAYTVRRSDRDRHIHCSGYELHYAVDAHSEKQIVRLYATVTI